MRPTRRFAVLALAWSLALLSNAPTPSFGQSLRQVIEDRFARQLADREYMKRVGDHYGLGAQGTIGRGTDNLPWGPSDPRTQGRYSLLVRLGLPLPDDAYYSMRYPSAPSGFTAPVPATPYLTNHWHEPGDGYRYPLYYNPATRSYFYYPVRR